MLMGARPSKGTSTVFLWRDLGGSRRTIPQLPQLPQLLAWPRHQLAEPVVLRNDIPVFPSVGFLGIDLVRMLLAARLGKG